MTTARVALPTGFGVGIPWQRAENEPAWYYDALDRLHPAWWHNWKYDRTGMAGYYPMLWRTDMESLAAALPTMREYADRLWLLGNEPERVQQSNTEPHTFAATVQALRAVMPELPIALPGILWNDEGRAWLAEYKAAGGPLPDVWHFHIYCYSADQVWSIVDHMRSAYGDRPIIISEIAGAVDDANEDVMRGVRRALADGRIQAAAWFSAYDEVWPDPNLLTDNCTLTRLGDVYIAEPELHTTYIPAVHA